MRRRETEFANGANLLDQVHDAIVVTDLTGRITLWNRPSERLFGYTRKQIEGTLVSVLVIPEDTPELSATVVKSLLSTGSVNAVVRARRKDGAELFVEVHATTLLSRSGKPVGYVASCNNVSVQRRAAEDLRRAYDHLTRTIEERTVALKAMCKELRESEHNRRIVLANSPGVVYACQHLPPHTTTFVSDNITKVFGFQPAELLQGGAFWVDHIHPDDLPRLAAVTPDVEANGEATAEYRLKRADGEYRRVRDHVAAIRDESGSLIGFSGYVSDITESVKRDEEFRRTERLRIAAETLVNTQEAERRRIARELHDELMQRVSAMAVDIAALERDMGSNRPVRTRLRNLRRELAAVSDDLQSIAYELHSLILQRQGLHAALEYEASLCRHRTGLRVSLAFDPACQSTPADIATCIYRVTQEALRNITEHSGAQTASIEVSRTVSSVVLRIADTGKGFAAKDPTSHGGLGIISMAERVRLLGGTFLIESAPGSGTTITASLPVDGGANAETTSTVG